MAFLWCRPLRRLPRRRATNRNGSSGNQLPSLSLYHVWRHGTKCRGGVGRRHRDDWCFMRVNAYADWVTTWQNGGGKGAWSGGSCQYAVTRSSGERYEWWDTSGEWLVVEQNRGELRSRTGLFISVALTVLLFFFPPCTAPAVAIQSFAPRLLVTSVIHWRRPASISPESLSRLII
jgi:hypothetical protein